MVGNNVGHGKTRVLFAKGSWKIFVIVNLSRPLFDRRIPVRGAVDVAIKQVDK